MLVDNPTKSAQVFFLQILVSTLFMPPSPHSLPPQQQHPEFLFFNVFIYLAALNLNCVVWDLWLWCTGYGVLRLIAPWPVGF